MAVRTARGARDAAALFVVVREERGAPDVRFIGDFKGAAAGPLADVLRQVMRRGPSFIHLDLREVAAVDEEGMKQLAHAVRICRRHRAMVRISASRPVEDAAETAGVSALLGILPRGLRDEMPAAPDRARL